MSHGRKIISLKINTLWFEQKRFVMRIVIMIMRQKDRGETRKSNSVLIPDDISLSESVGSGVLDNKLQRIMGNSVTWF